MVEGRRGLGEEYRDYCLKFKKVWHFLEVNSRPLGTIVSEICEFRQYYGESGRWLELFKKVGLACVSSEDVDMSVLKKGIFEDLALFSKNGNFLLDGRYIIPVRDMVGNIIALIGWYPDSRRYITTPSKFFSKDCLLFGLEQLSESGVGAEYFLAEGIFDTLSLRLSGYRAVGLMGISSGRVKEVLYGLFGRLVGVPDNDEQGMVVIKNDKWSLPSGSSYLRWKGNFDGDIYIKDIDKLCNLYEEESVKELLGECLKEKNRIITIDLE